MDDGDALRIFCHGGGGANVRGVDEGKDGPGRIGVK